MLNGLSGPRKNLAFPFTLDLSVFTVLRFATCVAVLELFSKSFKVISLFSYQGSLSPSLDDLISLSYLLLSVNIFFCFSFKIILMMNFKIF